MRFYETKSLERIGFDFYCDIANNIVKARRAKEWTQKELARQSGIKESRLSRIEGVKIRISLDDLKKLSSSLDVTINWITDAEIDSQIGQCLYLIWVESHPDFKLYIKATSKREAFMLFDDKMRKMHIAYESRDRFFVKLVGVPVTEKEIQDKFPRRTAEDLPIEPD